VSGRPIEILGAECAGASVLGEAVVVTVLRGRYLSVPRVLYVSDGFAKQIVLPTRDPRHKTVGKWRRRFLKDSL